MRLLRSYFLKEFSTSLVLSLGVLTFVMLLGNLIKIADLIINKGVDILSVGKLFLFMIPTLLTYTLPVAALVAILISLGRLSSDNEIIAIKAAGINIFNLILPLLTIGLILSLLLVILNDRIIPYTRYASRKTLAELGIKNPAAIFEPGVFINTFQNYVIFIYSIDQNKLNNVRIYEPQGEDKPARTIIAKKGEFIALPEKKMVKLKLIDGTSDEPDPDNPNSFYKLNFKTYFMNLNLSPLEEKEQINKKNKDMTIQELLQAAERLKKEGIEPLPLFLEINKRIALAFSCFIFILLGSSLAIITRRREKSINLGLAFIIVGIYYLLLLGTETLSLQGYLPSPLIVWIPNLIFGILGAILIYRVCLYA